MKGFTWKGGLAYYKESSSPDNNFGIFLGLGKHVPVAAALDIILKARLLWYIATGNDGSGIGFTPDMHAGLRLRF